jgi:ascorbate-specific PTS system EIIC-type component UlaA
MLNAHERPLQFMEPMNILHLTFFSASLAIHLLWFILVLYVLAASPNALPPSQAKQQQHSSMVSHVGPIVRTPEIRLNRN